jgi:hypothetical protein
VTRLAGERLRRLFRTAVAPKKITAMLLQRKPMPNAMLLVGKREVKVQLKLYVVSLRLKLGKNFVPAMIVEMSLD